jgi:Holliday junction DNA helicase RuvA
MIAYLSGKILKKFEKSIILNTGTVGYLVNISSSKIHDLEENSEAEFFTYTAVREDAIDIYGFSKLEELEFFKKLISISGVGPKTAQEILSIPLNKLKNAILNEDTSTITSVPKVGKKIADRIILELKNKVELEPEERDHQTIKSKTSDEVIEAISRLGYNKKQIENVLSTLPKEITKSEEIIKYFLQHA